MADGLLFVPRPRVVPPRHRSPELVHEPMSEADVREAARLDWEHRDLFDRLIVAAARRLGLPLLTRDRAITDRAQDTGGIEVAW